MFEIVSIKFQIVILLLTLNLIMKISIILIKYNTNSLKNNYLQNK